MRPFVQRMQRALIARGDGLDEGDDSASDTRAFDGLA
jgi:hypothetical protein